MKTKVSAKKVFKKLRNTFVIPNVRDAVRGLADDSGLNGAVEYYGDRTVIMDCHGMAMKSPRGSKEANNIKFHHGFFREMGIGTSNIFQVPEITPNDGIVSRLLYAEKQALLDAINGGQLQFFVDTKESDILSEWMGIKKTGPSAEVSRVVNNKVSQREAVVSNRETIFPPHFIATNEKEAVRFFQEISLNGEAMLKIGHLASGEGMIFPKNKEDVRTFWKTWKKILRKNGYPEKVIIEQRMPLVDKFNSVSVQFFKDDADCSYLGSSVQHIGGDGVVHEGNKVGVGIHSELPLAVEKEMIKKSRVMLSLFPQIRGFVGFDFIICEDGQVLMTEINLRMTASTLLFSLIHQVGDGLSLDLRKVHAGKNPKMKLIKLLKKLRTFNNSDRLVLPLNGRLYDETGDMFMIVCAPTFDEADDVRSEVLSWLK